MWDRAEADKRLSLFLINFKDVYCEFAGTGESADSIFGECAGILQSLMSVVDECRKKYSCMQSPVSVTKLFVSALETMDILLRDEKYRKRIVDSPASMQQIFDLLSVAGNVESTKIALRMINSFASSPDDRNVLSQDVFCKLRSLLNDGDEGLVGGIMKILKSFLSDDVSYSANGVASSSRQGVFSSNHLERKLQAVASNLTDTTHDETVSAAVQDSVAILLDCAEAGLFPPTSVSLQSTYDTCEKSRSAAELPSDRKDNDVMQAGVFDCADDTIRELMRSQGLLVSLADLLSYQNYGRSTQLEIMHTISRLILNNARNQLEFRQANGYFRIQMLLEKPMNYKPAEDRVGHLLFANNRLRN